MKPGDRILLDGAAPATVKALRTPAQMCERLPMMSAIFEDAAESGAGLVAIVTLDREAPATGIGPTTVLIKTPAGWETAMGEPITVDPLKDAN
jgi:hypothetical protein